MRKFPAGRAAILIVFLALMASPSTAQGDFRAIYNEILGLYASYDVVLLGEQHDGKLSFDFLLGLLRHSQFAEIVQDIVIESANSLYQPLLDDFVLRLKEVPEAELRLVWRNTTQPSGVWDPPIYEEFIRAVRDINKSRSPERRIRLIAGDPPIDWKTVASGNDYLPYASLRDETPFKIIEQEILRKNRKGLVIYGGAHLIGGRKASVPNAAPAPDRRTIGSLLEKNDPGKAYTVIPWSARYGRGEVFQGIDGLARTPVLIRLETSPLAAVPGKKIFPFLPAEPAGDLINAILYFGSAADETVDPDPSARNDAAYQSELKRRMEILIAAVKAARPDKK